MYNFFLTRPYIRLPNKAIDFWRFDNNVTGPPAIINVLPECDLRLSILQPNQHLQML